MIRRAAVLSFSTILLLLCGCQPGEQAASDAPAPAPTPAVEAPKEPEPWYENEIRAFEEADKASMPLPGQVLGVGSSSIRLWSTLAQDMAPAPVINRGFGGSKTGEVLAVFDRVVLPYKPSVILYYCGDNDLGTDNQDSKSAADGFITFDKRARKLWPGVRVLYIPIKASVQRWSNWPAMEAANAMVRDYCEHTPGATYLDTITPTLMSDGRPDPTLFREDGLHLNEKGYAVWTKVIRPVLLDAWAGRSK